VEYPERQQSNNDVGEKQERCQADSRQLIAIQAGRRTADADEREGRERCGAYDDLQQNEEEGMGRAERICHNEFLE
jgi:hypothetical protein